MTEIYSSGVIEAVTEVGTTHHGEYDVEYFNVRRLRHEPPIGYSNISLSLYLEAELIAGTGLKTYQFLKGKQGLISPKALF